MLKNNHYEIIVDLEQDSFGEYRWTLVEFIQEDEEQDSYRQGLEMGFAPTPTEAWTAALKCYNIFEEEVNK